MLKLLQIENIAVIEKADIEFSCGLNVLTGETGAGKSIVIDAISAVTGGRASREIIRTGAEAATVTAVFADVSEALAGEYGIAPDESGEVFITRRMTSDGKNACRINGAPVPVNQLRDFGAELLDIHGQNDGRKLLDEGAHLAYLDDFSGSGDALSAYREVYTALREKKGDIESLTMDEQEKERRVDALRYQIEEIERANPKPGELDELTARREMLLNASRLTESVETAFAALSGGDVEDGAIALIDKAQGELEYAARYSAGLRMLGERLNDLKYTAQDISDELRDLRAELDFAPGELNELETRLDTLKRIARKYGGEEQALEFLERGKAQLSDIEDSAGRLAKLEAEAGALTAKALELARGLSAARREHAKKLEEKVMEELAQLSMPGARFIVEFSEAAGEDGLSANGADEARFMLSANAGESPGRIGRIASGGELARIMLALKSIIGSGSEAGTMVFDEVDAGVSGIAAQRVGEKLARLARDRQVLCVTHLPQIAVMADTHFEIQKNVVGDRTYTSVESLEPEGRKREVARLSGGEHITQTTLASAAEQLEAAEKFKAAQAGR
ncbi:MAG: DNA repair protein RecN [Oscillospiraceae bacterium]|nr:DNA repair protein RecN [Oscillospiraceae bacterium]